MSVGSLSDPLDGKKLATARWSVLDPLLLATLLVLGVFGIVRRFDWQATPIEGAAMLLRYAENFANGHGIRWNIDGAPVDGATDFLFMVATGALSRVAHIGVATACRILTLGSHLFSIALVFVAGRRILGGNRWLCAAMAVYLMAGPATEMADGCIGAPVFAASLLCCWCAALAFANNRQIWGMGILTAVFALLSGLIRPEFAGRFR
jgi:arabinofuranosyltransferase